MEKVLVKTNYNWADEADFPSFCIVTKDELQKMKNFFKEFFDNGCVSSVVVGTNEEIEFNSLSDVLYGMSVSELSSTEENTISKYFSSDYGECSLLRVYECAQDVYDELEDEDDNDSKIEEWDI